LFDRPKSTVGCNANGRRRSIITGFTVGLSALLLYIWEVLGSNLEKSTVLGVFVVFLIPFRQMPEEYLKLGNNHFLPHPFKLLFTISYSLIRLTLDSIRPQLLKPL